MGRTRRKEDESEDTEGGTSWADLFRHRRKSPETREELRQSVIVPPGPYDTETTTTGWRPMPGGGFVPYPIRRVDLTCGIDGCERLFTDDERGRALLKAHELLVHRGRRGRK